MSFYRHSALYHAFFAPSEELRGAVDGLVRLHKPGGRIKPRRVLDPACGSGLWLEHFLDRGADVVGIEIDPQVATPTRGRIEPRGGLVEVGDMRHPPTRIVGPFDLAINLDNSVGHLGGSDDLAAHLSAMHGLVGRRGIYLLGLAVREDDDVVLPATIYERGPVEISGGGFAAIRSETLGLVEPEGAGGLRCERIRHYVLTAGVPDTAPLFVEQYDLITFPFALLRTLLQRGGPWKLLDCRDATDESLPRRPLRPGCGDVLLVLQPAAARPASSRRGPRKPVGGKRR